MQRRNFIRLLGGAAVAWPLAARAQQVGKTPQIGYLGVSSPSLEPHYVEAFRQKLRELGHVEGKNIAIEYRWAVGQDDRLPNLASELVRLKPDVIVTTGTPGAVAAMQATKTIPIVMASSADPVGSGLVASLARPGGNVTGFTILGPELEGKRLELLKQAVPGLSRLAVLWNPSNPGIVSYFETVKNAGRVLQISLGPVVEIRRSDELDSAFTAIASARPHALVVIADRFLLSHRKQIVEFAGEAVADHVSVQGICGRRGTHVVCAEQYRVVSRHRNLRGQDPQGREAWRPSDPGAHQVRAGDQP